VAFFAVAKSADRWAAAVTLVAVTTPGATAALLLGGVPLETGTIVVTAASGGFLLGSRATLRRVSLICVSSFLMIAMLSIACTMEMEVK